MIMEHRVMVGKDIGVEVVYSDDTPTVAGVTIFTSKRKVALAVATAIGGKLEGAVISDPAQHQDNFHLTLTDHGSCADKPLGDKVYAVCSDLGHGHLVEELAKVRPRGLSL